MIDYKIENGHAEILKWYRNRKGERKTRIIKDFEPYFLVKDDEFVPNDARIVRVDPTDIKSLSGERLKRIVTRLPIDIKELREKFSRTWEADVPFADRYRIDVGEEPIKNPVILFFDIETQNDLDINSDKEMISLACYDNVSKEFTQFLWKDGQTKVIKQHKGNRNLVFARTEKEMLKIFVEYFRKVDPDIITGWNSNPFDLPFLYNRLEKTKIGGASLSPTGRTRIRNDELQIQGRYCFDLLPAYKKVHENEMDSFRLDDVANIELGTGKEGSSENIMEMWDHDIKSLIKYNIRDVEILVELEKKLELFKFYFEYAAKTNGSLENVYHNSKMVDSYLLTYAQNKRLALPTKQSSTGTNEKIKGATVFQPSKGLKHDIAIMDYKSLYPSIIISFNMSPETCNGFMDFDQDKKGILPSALEDLFEERARLKKAGKNNEQRVVKELMNSFYGVMLFSSFRLNNRDVGMSITNTGRNLLQWAKDHAEAINDKYKVVYGDSVTGETPITIRKNGVIDIIPIRELYLDDKYGLRKPVKGIEILSDCGWTPIKYVYKHKSDKQVYTVNAYGGRVDCTEDHSLIVNGKEIKPTEAKSVEFVEYKLPSNDVTFDEEMAFVLGFFAADGSIMYRNNSPIVQLNKADISKLKTCGRILTKHGFEWIIYDTLKSSGVYKLSIKNPRKSMAEHIFNKCYTKNKEKRVPTEILNAPNNVKMAFFDGYYYGDGTNGLKTKEFTSISQTLLSGLTQIINENGFEWSVSTRKDKQNITRIRTMNGKRRKPVNKIAALREIEHDGWVYDIETENHHFCGGIGNILLHNTDSIFVEGVETREEAELIEKTINESLDEFAEQNKLKRHIFQIEFENFIELGLFTGKKKRYALKTDEGYKIRGFETRRSSTPRMGRELQENILKEILEGKEKHEIFKELNKTEKQIKENPDLEIIGVPATLTKNPEEYETNSQHLRASKYSNKYLEKTFKAHDKMLLVFVQSVPLNYPKTDVIALERGDELPEGFKLDYNKHIDKCVTSLTNPILEVLNWNRSVGKSVFSF